MAEQRRSAERGLDVARLRERVERDPGCADFPALAEVERRAGRFGEAQRIAEQGLRASPDRLAGRVALGLALLEQGDLAAARRELAAVFEPVEAAAEASRTESSPESRRSLPRGEDPRRAGSAASVRSELPVGEGSAFRTRTMARLLENQGDRGRAEEILEGLETSAGNAAAGPLAPEPGSRAQPGGAPGPEDPLSADKKRATLERWLRNVQRNRA